MDVSKQSGASGSGRPDLLNEPLYTLPDVAGLLHVPERTLHYWVHGGEYPLAGGATGTASPIVGKGTGLLSFQDLAELSVIAHLRHLGFRFRRLRLAGESIKKETGTKRPFLTKILAGGIEEIALELEDGLTISMTSPGQRIISEDEILKRIEVDNGLVVSVRPFSRPTDPAHDPQIIEINPRRRFGRPITRPHGFDVAALHDRHGWGESIEELMEDLRAGREEIEEAISYQRLYLGEAA